MERTKAVRRPHKLIQLRRRRRADVQAQALASLPDSLYTFYNIYMYFLIINFISTSGSL